MSSATSGRRNRTAIVRIATRNAARGGTTQFRGEGFTRAIWRNKTLVAQVNRNGFAGIMNVPEHRFTVIVIRPGDNNSGNRCARSTNTAGQFTGSFSHISDMVEWHFYAILQRPEFVPAFGFYCEHTLLDAYLSH